MINIGYYNKVGLFQPVRYLLELAGVEYNESRFKSDQEWQIKKKNLQLPYKNLPYFSIDNIKIYDSETIVDYLIERFNMKDLIDNTIEVHKIDSLRHFLNEISLCLDFYSVHPESKIEFQKDNLIPKLKQLKYILGTKQYLLGNYTIVDIYFLSYIYPLKRKFPAIYAEFEESFEPLLVRLLEIPQISTYIQKGRNNL